MSSNQGGAGAAPRRLAWAVLERAAEFVDALPGGRDYNIHPKKAAPNLCNLRLSRALLSGEEHDVEEAYVECADADGNIVVSVWGPAAAPPRLLVCHAGTGTVDCLPEVPEHVGALELEPGAASTGILPAGGGQGHYTMAQLQRAAAGSVSSSSSSAAAKSRALCFCSASRTWSSNTVAAPGHPRRFDAFSDEEGLLAVGEAAGQHPAFFEPHSVVGYGHSTLAFVDLKQGVLLLLDPAAPATARTVPLPSPEPEEDGGLLDAAAHEDEWEAATRRFVAWSQGSLSVLQIASDGSLVMHRLEERQDQWLLCFRVPRDRIMWSDANVGHRLALAAAAEEGFSDVGVGPVDPANRNRVCFLSFDAGLAFTVEVEPGKSSARFYDTANVRSLGTCLHVVSSLLDVADPAAAEAGAPSTWKRTVKDTGKRLGSQAWHAFKVGRNHVHRIPPVAQVAGVVGKYFAVPHASAVAGAVAGLAVLNLASTVGEEFVNWWNKPRPIPNNGRPIGTTQDAAEAIHDWIVADKPPGAIVYPAPDLARRRGLSSATSWLPNVQSSCCRFRSAKTMSM